MQGQSTEYNALSSNKLHIHAFYKTYDFLFACIWCYLTGFWSKKSANVNFIKKGHRLCGLMFKTLHEGLLIIRFVVNTPPMLVIKEKTHQPAKALIYSLRLPSCLLLSHQIVIDIGTTNTNCISIFELIPIF